MSESRLGTAVVEIKGDDSGLNRTLDASKKKVEGLGGVLKTSLGTAAGFAAAQVGIQGIGGAFDFLIGKGAAFEKSLGAVKAATGATTEEMESMRKLALQIGADTSKSASEAVLAMGELAKAGMPVEKILQGGAMAAVNMAEATGIDVPNAAVLVSNALNTFQADGLSAADAANIFARAANASAIDVNDLGLSLSAVGPVAASAGLSMEDFATAMGLMGNNAMRGSDAGTSLKAMIAGFTPVSDKAKDSMANLGFSAFDAAGNFESMPVIISRLSKSLEGLTEEQRAATLELWFGSDGVRAANILLKEGTTGWQNFTEAMGEAPDIAEQSRIRMQGLAGQWEMFQGSLETISITLASLIIPALTSLLTKINELTNKIVPLVKAFFDLDIVKTAIQGIADAFNAIPKEAVEGLMIALGFIAADFIIGGIIALTAALFGMAVAVVAATWPILLIIVAIAALSAAILYAIRHWDDIKAAVTGAVNAIYQHVQRYLPLILAVFMGPLGVLLGLVIQNFTKIKDFIFSTLDAIVTFVTDHWKTILVMTTGPIGLMLIAVIHNFEAIKNAVETALNFVLDIATSIWNSIYGTIAENARLIWEVVTDVFGKVKDDVTEKVNAIKNLVVPAFSAIALAAEEAWNYLRDRVSAAAQGLYDFLKPIVEQVLKWADKLLDAGKKILGAAGGGVLGTVVSAGGSILGTEGWAAGGRPTPGQPAIVGERGWELWVPDRAGTILNHDDAMSAMAGNAQGPGIQVLMPNSTIYARDEAEAYRSMETVGWGIDTAASRRGTRR